MRYAIIALALLLAGSVFAGSDSGVDQCTIGGQVRVGGEVSDLEEIILKQNTKYLFRITSGTDNNRVSIKFRWYEHVNRG